LPQDFLLITGTKEKINNMKQTAVEWFNEQIKLNAEFREIFKGRVSFTIGESKIEELLENFTAIWQSHGEAVKGFGTALYGQFIILMADESYTTVGGCSTDSSVHVIKEIEKMIKIRFIKEKVSAVKNPLQRHSIKTKRSSRTN
jgi:hypothetical protein